MKTDIAEQWAAALAAADIVVEAYTDLLHASDALADALNYKQEYILSHVMPQTSKDRRMAKRILAWMKENETSLRNGMAYRAEQLEHEKQKRALLARLQLTEEEKELLGIE
jgi:hypothetical protein